MSKEIEPIYRLFGAKVQMLRDTLCLTQAELALRVGLSRGAVANIETGKQRVLLGDVEKFANAFGTRPKVFLKGIWL